MNKARAYAILLAALLFSVVALYVVLSITKSPVSPVEVATEASKESNIPPLTPEIEAMLEKSNGFAVLFSYTDRGFEPTTASLKKGETARFTNNSDHDVWIAAEGTVSSPIYPEKGTCGQSSLDTCRVLHPMEFWEFTFVETGTWIFVNNLNKEEGGEISVSVL